MIELTSKERIGRTYRHEETDRIPIVDAPWAGTIRRWHKEGMPDNMNWVDYFGTDKVGDIGAVYSPMYETKVLEETDRYIIITSDWGVTMKQFKEEDSTPEFLDYKINSADAWAEAKKRMIPAKDRVNWDYLKAAYPTWQKDGYWLRGNFWFGFDVTHSWMAGMVTVLCAMLEDPEWVMDMFDTYLKMNMAEMEMIWEAGYKFDQIFWPDDMGYKDHPFFSPQLYKELLQPYQKKAVQWAHDRGIFAELHSCGNIMTLLPDVIETGIDGLNPIEIKAGMDAPKIKQEYGKKLTLHGGINASLCGDPDKLYAEVDRMLPILAEGGGYIFATDHSIPNNTALETFKVITDKVKAYHP